MKKIALFVMLCILVSVSLLSCRQQRPCPTYKVNETLVEEALIDESII